MSTRTQEQRDYFSQRVVEALQGNLLPAHDQRICTKLIGVTHRNVDGSDRQEAIGQLTQFDSVRLVRDKLCPYDANAIEVWADIVEASPRRRKGESAPLAPQKTSVQIGFIDRELAATLAPAIDRGEPWRAMATRIAGKITLGVELLLFRLVNGGIKPRGVVELERELDTTRNRLAKAKDAAKDATADDPNFARVNLKRLRRALRQRTGSSRYRINRAIQQALAAQ